MEFLSDGSDDMAAQVGALKMIHFVADFNLSFWLKQFLNNNCIEQLHSRLEEENYL